MMRNANGPVQPRFGRRTLGACSAILVLALPLGLLAGCSDDVQNEFNSAALSSIETGLKAIADGLISGMAAVADSQITANGGTTTTDTSNSGTTGG